MREYRERQRGLPEKSLSKYCTQCRSAVSKDTFVEGKNYCTKHQKIQ
jgi:hypothetical protein